MTKEEKAARSEERKQVREEYRAERKGKRMLRKARRKARPLWLKILSVLAKVAAVLIVLAIIAAQFISSDHFITYIRQTIAEDAVSAGYSEADPEAERALIPADEDAQAAIKAMPGYSSDDTWAIYVYMIGSNLESDGQNDLSSMISTLSSLESSDNSSASREQRLTELQEYTETISAAGLELPGPMYYIDAPEAASSTPVTEDVTVAVTDGAATMDIREMTRVTLPENIELVIETGGATHWTDPLINPNRVQRFVYSGDTLTEEYSEPSHSMATVDSLADFLSYCEENHDADHKILIFWDHGSGAFGYGHDEIYNQSFSLSQIREALGKVYRANIESPAFELIGFDACLMSSGEVMEELDGYGRYFAGSEEVEPGYGWFYTDWLQQLADDPSMNGAQVGLAIADSYMDYYARLQLNMSLSWFAPNDVTFSVLDIHEAAETYRAYEDLAETILASLSEDPSLLSTVSQAAHSSIHYAGDVSDIFNTIDLGVFLDYLPDELADAVAPVREGLRSAVLYTRSDSILEGSQGLSVYYPDHVTSTNSVLYLMDYVDNIASTDALSALYFYKSAGCLSEDMQQALEDKDITPPRTIDLTALKSVASAPVTLEDGGNYSVAVSAEAQELMQNIGLTMARVEDNDIIYYGTDSEAFLDGDGNLCTAFEGKWIALEGQLLSVSVISDTPYTVTYSSPVLLDGDKATLVFAYDKDTEEFVINGAYKDDDAYEADYIGRNVSDILPGSKITPVYETSKADTGKEGTQKGKAVRVTSSTSISLVDLPSGSYLSAITFASTRGDEFSTAVVELNISGGNVKESAVSESYAIIMGD